MNDETVYQLCKQAVAQVISHHYETEAILSHTSVHKQAVNMLIIYKQPIYYAIFFDKNRTYI